MSELTEREKTILRALEDGLPISRSPWQPLADELGITEAEVVGAAEDLHIRGIIKRFGLIFNSRKLGYSSALCAARCGHGDIVKVRSAAEDLPGITHCYLREDPTRDVWFTMMASSGSELAENAERFVQEAGLSELIILPALKMLKLDVRFVGGADRVPRTLSEDDLPAELSARQWDVIRAIGTSLAVEGYPFRAAALQMGITEDELLQDLVDLQDKGVIKRFGATVDHRRIGQIVNLLAAFRIDDHEVERSWDEIVRSPDVSHLYLRKRAPGWDFDLYAMIHGTTREHCLATALNIANKLGAEDLRPMFTLEEIKRSAPRYM